MFYECNQKIIKSLKDHTEIPLPQEINNLLHGAGEISIPIGNVTIKRDESGGKDKLGIEVISTAKDVNGTDKKRVTTALVKGMLYSSKLPELLNQHELETKMLIENDAKERRTELKEFERTLTEEAAKLIGAAIKGMHEEIKIAVHEMGKENLRLLVAFQLNPQLAQELIKKELGESELPKQEKQKSEKNHDSMYG